jgi:hypothetical protein
MRAPNRFFSTITNAGTVTSSVATFQFSGGTYSYVAAAATWGAGGSVGLVLGIPTGTTTASMAVLPGITANAIGTITLPPVLGTITAIGTITGGSLTITRVPGE